MPATIRHKVVRFTPDAGGDGAALKLSSPWRVTAGLKHNVNTAQCSSAEYANLGGQLGITGSVQFCWADPAQADVELDNVYLAEAEPVQYGRLAGGGGAVVPVMWRLTFWDDRWRFQEPRGGRLTQGLLNPSVAVPDDPDRSNVPQPQSMSDLMRYCLDAMGFDDNDGAGPAIPPEVDQTDAPQDLRWFGTHAPAQLEELLALADCVIGLNPDGTYTIANRGDGADPAIPAGRALPPVTLAGADARGKTIVFTSYPTQVAVVLTADDFPDGSHWRYVGRDKDSGAWVAIDDCGQYGSGTAAAAMARHFPATPDPTLQEGAFRYLQLDADLYDPVMSPIMRRTWGNPPAAGGGGGAAGGEAFEGGGDGGSGGGGGGGGGADDPDDPWTTLGPNGLPPQVDIDLRARVAVFNASGGTWAMAPGESDDAADGDGEGGYVRVPVVGVYDGNVIKTGVRLTKLKAGVTTTADPDADGVPLDLTGTADLKVRLSVGDAVWDAEQQLWKPGYFYAGFTGTPNDPRPLNADEAEAAMKDRQTIVVPIPDLVAVRYGTGGDVVNAKQLTDRCRDLAGRLLQDAEAPPRLLAGVGFLDFTFDGRLTEVELEQEAVLTRFRVDSWFRPAGSYLAGEWDRLRRPRESHPAEARTQGGRQAAGLAGSAAPVQPMEHYSVAPSGVSPGLTLVALNQSGGSDGGGAGLAYASWTYDVFSLDGSKQYGSACSVVAPRAIPAEATKATHGLAYLTTLGDLGCTFNAGGGSTANGSSGASNASSGIGCTLVMAFEQFKGTTECPDPASNASSGSTGDEGDT